MKTKLKISGIAMIILAFSSNAKAQTENSGIDSLIVEQIDASSVMDGGITYRVFVDLAEGYEIQAVKGVEEYPLSISTTTSWYNDPLGASVGQNIFASLLETPGFESLAFDSFVSMGAASDSEFGVPYFLDTEDDAVNGRITLDDTVVVTSAQTLGAIDISTPFGTETSSENLYVDDIDGGQYFTFDTDNNDFTPNNVHMLGQFTTDGEFAFCINLQTRVAQTSTFVESWCATDSLLIYPVPVVIGIEDLGYQNESISVYPNPVSDNIQIKLELIGDYSALNYKLMDASGRVVFDGMFNNVRQGEVQSLNIAALNAGLYFVRFEADSEVIAVKKIIKK